MTLTADYNRIAHSYDASRGYPPEAAAQIGAAVAARCGQGARVVELGVGTGRVARPLASAGLRVMGVDIAREMLALARDGGLAHLAQADVAALPLAGGRFDAAVTVQVLHHVADWRAALREALRVLRPGGLLLYGSDQRDPGARSEALRRRLREIVAELAPQARPPGAGAALAQELERLGASAEPPLTAARWTAVVRPAEVLAALAEGRELFSWALPDDLLAAALARLRAWAPALGDLDQPEAVEHRLELSVARNRG